MFDDRYQAVIADTEASKSIHYHLRYRVYCLEKRFEPVDRFEDQMEIDEYDRRSVHLLIQHKPSGQWVATARLVLGEPETLPIARFARFSLDGIDIRDKRFAELSRLSVLKSYRRHGEQQVNEPEVLLGLIRAARDCSAQMGLDYWLFLCRRSIMRIIGYFGMEMRIIGEPCEHRGIRYPYLGDLANGFDGIAKRSPEVHAMFSRKNTLIPYSELYPETRIALAA
ncbi:MAG TPA: PEP-CTERM/exosortase system-associated acyltransferase [Methylothermaceae bacterium]|nr:PEP-CTERM/exosortase system-associated acyltransferase [Methylothermaceae bacterium]